MKVVTAKEMARIEHLAYAEGASEEAFMNAAGAAVALHIKGLPGKPKITLLCGSGNNAGDAYVAGKLLREEGYDVTAFSLAPFEKSSPLCQLQRKRFGEVIESSSIPFEEGLIVDALFGTGFHGEMKEPYRSVIGRANASSLPIISIDIPSGVNGTTGEVSSAIIATETLFLGLPKIGCFGAWEHAGHIFVYPFGLEEKFIEEANEEAYLVYAPPLPPIVRTRHKYQAGYVVGVGGSPGMPGAAILSAYATLRAGAGITRLFHPAGMEEELANMPPEVIRHGYTSIDPIVEAMEKANAVFIGPGFGDAIDTLRALLPKVNKPCVLDAEALTLIAQYGLEIPKRAVITPHTGEMKRLLKEGETPQEFADTRDVIVLLKGAPTTIFVPYGKPYISARGDPGMATAGSGDVLTGIIAAFLAQTGDPLEAAKLGAFYHGVAGEIAAAELTSYSMIASDIIEALPEAFLQSMQLS
ncbi:MAG: NAD(P)H-hydrate dehydratase [Chlamydiales bacterium]|nr:NAD(P)H-hydrate dehydratase [Chlamydiales bacterium]